MHQYDIPRCALSSISFIQDRSFSPANAEQEKGGSGSSCWELLVDTMSIACNSWAHSVKLGGSRGGDYTERSCKGTEWNCGIHVRLERFSNLGVLFTDMDGSPYSSASQMRTLTLTFSSERTWLPHFTRGLQMHALLQDETAVTVEETVHCATNWHCK